MGTLDLYDDFFRIYSGSATSHELMRVIVYAPPEPSRTVRKSYTLPSVPLWRRVLGKLFKHA